MAVKRRPEGLGLETNDGKKQVRDWGTGQKVGGKYPESIPSWRSVEPHSIGIRKKSRSNGRGGLAGGTKKGTGSAEWKRSNSCEGDFQKGVITFC